LGKSYGNLAAQRVDHERVPMARRTYPHAQLDLFEAAPVEKPTQVVASAAVSPELMTLRQRLPSNLYLGTSSWAFAGWRGLVFAPDAAENQLARHGLAAYAQHPLLRTVGIDRTYYAPLPAADFATYAAAVPDDFRFLVKAHELCTLASFRPTGRYAHRSGEHNELFLQPAYATDHIVGPYIEGLEAKAGPLLWQFPPQNVPALGGAQRFAERLFAFLQALPRGPLYAIELRNRELLTPSYAAALADAGAVHCLNVHPTMPPIHEQHRLVRSTSTPALVIRWMLHPRHRYEAAKVRYQPFNRIVDDDPLHRDAIATLCLDATAAGRAAFVIVNNKAEGSAPLTVCRLAERLAQTRGISQ
jgi:uncharacterized protein YecE (DUF72 family)